MAMYDTEGVPVMETGGPPPPRKSPNFLWPAVVVALLIIGGIFVWLHQSSTDQTARTSVVAPVDNQSSPRPSNTVPGKPKLPTSAMTHGMGRTSVKPAANKTVSAEDRQISQFRKTFEANGWSVYWDGSKKQVVAWKSEGKTGHEVRLTRGSQQATVLKTGGRNIIRQRWTASLVAAPHLRGNHLYTSSRALLQNILTHNE